MIIKSFKIENFRNLINVECLDVPNLMVICGKNGCGKSALLEALIKCKNAQYPHQIELDLITAEAEESIIKINFGFKVEEKAYLSGISRSELQDEEELIIKIYKDRTRNKSSHVGDRGKIWDNYSSDPNAPGFIEYISSERQIRKKRLESWNTQSASDEYIKNTLKARENKFEYSKDYLITLKMRDMDKYVKAHKANRSLPIESLDEIRSAFNHFFYPMAFCDINLDIVPFKFEISTPLGIIDMDEMSSGEKEIFNMIIRIIHLKPKNSIFLIDEIDSHLHPELQRMYFKYIKALSSDNQVIMTTHSPEIMMEAGAEFLFTILKYPDQQVANQLLKVSDNKERHDALCALMGTKGIIGFNKKIVFIEGRETSADLIIYEHFFPSTNYDITFVPAGDSLLIQKTAERINLLLEHPTTFQQYYAIVDGDFKSKKVEDRSRLFFLPVYHIENFLLDEVAILKTTQQLMRNRCTYKDTSEITKNLKELVLHDSHIRDYAGSMLHYQLNSIANNLAEKIRTSKDLQVPPMPDFNSILPQAKNILEKSIVDEMWKSRCKGRKILKLYCGQISQDYESFRNVLIENIKQIPKQLAEIIGKITND